MRPLLLFLLCASFAVSTISLTTPPVYAQSSPKQWVEEPAAPSPIAGQKRIALIIGNTHYGGAHDLANPENDARSIAKALGKLGFSSTVLLDADRDGMVDAFHTFASRIKTAGSSTVALLYYSGHGMQVDGENYLIPVGFQMPAYKADVGDKAFSAQRGLDEMQQASAQVNIVILDACRDNPFEGNKATNGKGLAKLETQGVLIAYATAAGKTASDNTTGKNGLYTKALLANLQTPGLTLNAIFKRTQKSVFESSNREQFPYVYDGLIDDNDFCLLPATGTAAPGTTVANTGTVTDTKARLQVSVNAANATITVDGTPIPEDEYVVNLLASTKKVVSVTVSAPGYEDQMIEGVTLVRGAVTPLNVKLVAVAPAKTVPSLSPSEVLGLIAPRTIAQYKEQMASIPGGTFRMGSNNGDEQPVHSVTISPFKMGRTPVTVAMWREYCAATNTSMPSAPLWGWMDDHPMVKVTWAQAKAYCDWAGLALPTEAQWEYAASGGKAYKYPWGNTFDSNKFVWRDNGGGKTAPVYRSDRVAVNDFGLVDMAGNMWQWCNDWYGGYEGGLAKDPTGPSSGEAHVLRAGSLNYSISIVPSRSFDHDGRYPAGRSYDWIGFRCCSP